MNHTHFSQALFLSTTMFTFNLKTSVLLFPYIYTFKLFNILSSAWLPVFIAILSSLQNRKQGTNTGTVAAYKKQIF